MSTTDTTTPADVQSLAAEASKFFYRKKRKEDDEKMITITKDDAPEWVKDMVHAAHGDMMPDDYRYEFITDALYALEANDDADRARDELEPDIYTSDLTAWLHSRNDRMSYVDDARAEYGDTGDVSTSDALMRGQLMEKLEVFDAVHAALDERADELND